MPTQMKATSGLLAEVTLGAHRAYVTRSFGKFDVMFYFDLKGKGTVVKKLRGFDDFAEAVRFARETLPDGYAGARLRA